MQKAQADVGPSTPPQVIHEDGSVTMQGESSTLATRSADDNASTKGVRSAAGSPAHSPQNSGANESSSDADGISNGIPTIRISTESNRERLKQEAERASANGVPESNSDDIVSQAASASLEKPVQAAAGEENGESTPAPPQHEAFSFSNKRLCERWLDNLFMVLYEVSRTRTCHCGCH